MYCCFHFIPIYLLWCNGTICHNLSFLSIVFKPPFSLSSLILFKRLLSSSLLSAIGWCHLQIWIYCYFSQQSWFHFVLHPAWHFAWCSLHIKLHEQGDNIQPWCTPFSIWSQSVVPCPVLTVVFWPAYRYLRRQVRWSSIPISLRIFHSLLCSAQLATLVWSKKQMFLWRSLAFSMIQWKLAIRSLVPLPFLNPAWTSGSSQFTYWWNLAWRI